MVVVELVEADGRLASGERYGVTADELLELQPPYFRERMNATALEAWLVDAGFAEPNGIPGRLVPTELGIEVGGALGFLGSWRPR